MMHIDLGVFNQVIKYEWAKLLLQLNEHYPEDWKIERSIYLYKKGTTMSIDKEYGGLVYGYSPDGNFTNDNKYF